MEPIIKSKDLPREILEKIPEGKVVTEEEVQRLAHLPLLTIFFLSLQRKVSATPVTALELAAYLGVEVKVAEGIFEYLERQGFIQAFKDTIPAYSLGLELNEITVKDLLELLAEFHDVLKKNVASAGARQMDESNKKYRKIYSQLAAEILQLFGEESANVLPV